MEVADMADPEAEHAPVPSEQQPQAGDAQAAERTEPQAERTPTAQAAAYACTDEANVLVTLGLLSQIGECSLSQATAAPAEPVQQETPQQLAAAAAQTEEAKDVTALLVKEEGSMRASPAWTMRPAKGEVQHTGTTLFAEICQGGDELALQQCDTRLQQPVHFQRSPSFCNDLQQMFGLLQPDGIYLCLFWQTWMERTKTMQRALAR
jgi:hypothetical protein